MAPALKGVAVNVAHGWLHVSVWSDPASTAGQPGNWAKTASGRLKSMKNASLVVISFIKIVLVNAINGKRQYKVAANQKKN